MYKYLMNYASGVHVVFTYSVSYFFPIFEIKWNMLKSFSKHKYNISQKSV
jgi:hypothetical protein